MGFPPPLASLLGLWRFPSLLLLPRIALMMLRCWPAEDARFGFLSQGLVGAGGS